MIAQDIIARFLLTRNKENACTEEDPGYNNTSFTQKIIEANWFPILVNKGIPRGLRSY